MTLKELAERTGVSSRTIRYYIAEKLLSGPTMKGRYAYYGEEYVDKIKNIKDLKNDGVPLVSLRSNSPRVIEFDYGVILTINKSLKECTIQEIVSKIKNVLEKEDY